MGWTQLAPRKRRPTTASPLTLKVLDRLKEVGVELPGDPESWVIERTYCGDVQKSAGAWTFTLEWKGSRDNHEALGYSRQIGSQWPASLVAKIGIDRVAKNGNIYPKGRYA